MPSVSRLLLLILSLLTAFFLFFYLSLSTIPYTARPSLFPRSAVISLADDNSTFFLARPAAFGPSLPGESKGGMTGRLFVVEEGELGCGDVKEEGVWGMRKSLGPWTVGGLDDGEENGALRSEKAPLKGLGNGKEPLAGNKNKRVRSAAAKTGLVTKPPSKKQASKQSFEEYKLSLSSQELELASHADIETLQDSALMEGRIVLIQRGDCGFLEKVLWAQRRGAMALIVGDYQKGRPLLTMYAKGDTSNVTIPAIFTTYTTAQLLTSLMPPERDPKENNGVRGHGETGDGDGDGKNGRDRDENDSKPHRDGLWITLTATKGPSSPFFDTLLVLVISPLVTLGVVYVMLTLRASIQRRRWRAPKSVVDSFPVRIYKSHGQERERSSPGMRQSNGPRDNDECTMEVGELLPACPGHRSEDQQQPTSAPSPPSTPASSRRRGYKSEESTFGSPPFHSTTSECVICLEEYVDGISRVMCLPCGHEFHAGCITPWLVSRRRTCPICKVDVVKGLKGSADGDGADDVESGNGVLSDSSSSGDDSSGYEVDEHGTPRLQGLFTGYGGLFDWRRIIGGIRGERDLGVGRANSERVERRRRREGLFIGREANERTPLITEHAGARV